MYLKKFKLINFRKFAEEENEIEFTDSQGIRKSRQAFTNDTHESDNATPSVITDQGIQESTNIASSTTLVVGKNNSGKTTIFEALDKLVNGSSESNAKFNFDDFNYNYIKKLVEKYDNDNYDILPCIKFVFTIGLDKGKDDLIVNLGHFIPISYGSNEIKIFIKYELTEEELFKDKLKKEINSEVYDSEDKTKSFYKLAKLINENLSNYKLRYYDEVGNEVKKFKLNNLIDFFKIQANKITADDCLSIAFNKIINARNNSNKSKNLYDSSDTEKSIAKINSRRQSVFFR